MTYHPDSVLVEKVAKETLCGFAGYVWSDLPEFKREEYREWAFKLLVAACPLVAGVIADRLDYVEDPRWLNDPGGFVRSEFVDGEA